MKLALFVGGGLGLRVFEHLLNSITSIECVFTDSKSIEIISLANASQIQLYIGNPRKVDALTFIDNHIIDLILSVNYLFIIERPLFSKARPAINIHGSLLPKYRGRTPHVWAIINNEVKTGITAHLIDDGCDTGDIVNQIKVPINHNDTGDDILRKFNKLYLPLIDSLIDDFESDNINRVSQDNNKATFFGKRSPEDGEINWGWQKERIRNWVRAQASPYPGAYTYYNGEKIIIDEVSYIDLGFNQSDADGSIVSLNPICIKTPNGVIKLARIRKLNLKNHLKVGEILGK